MIKKLTYFSLSMLFIFFFFQFASAQNNTEISGKVTDAESQEALVGVNIVVKNKVIGTITDTDGNFNLIVNTPPPITLQISIVGYQTREVEITESRADNLNINLEEQTIMGQEVVVSASRVEESIMQSPVTIEKMDILSIQQAPATDFYDAIASLKGVHVNQGSLNFPAINTRGFGAIANERFVQLIDGMDNSAPLLNFPTGNLTGISELDVESVELVPGASSALYGPNAFNGILLMNSKSPFEYQGLSAQAKVGLTTSEAQDQAYPLYGLSVRYAKAFKNRFAFKVNLSYFDAEDWIGNDYTNDRNSYRDATTPGLEPNIPGDSDFDGMNLYGDETVIPIALGAPFGTLQVTRTGFQEDALINDFSARSIKGDVALHYRLSDEVEAILSYRYGGGNSIYQGGEKYVLRNFNQDFIKAEIRSDNFFARAYRTSEDAGDSYNLTALGAFVNEAIRPSAIRGENGAVIGGWAPDYGQSYVLAIQGYAVNPATGEAVPAGNPEAAHAYARQVADRFLTEVKNNGSLQDSIKRIREAKFQTENGARLVALSNLYHAEFNYNFKNLVEFIEIQVGGNFRRYDLFSDGTVFNEDPEGTGKNSRITIDEFGVYTQLSKRLLADKLKLTGSVRYDKNENFEGQVTPRISAVYTLANDHNFRASFQTGFRNPQTQAQFLYFPASTGILLGGSKANAERYGLFEGGAYTERSYQQWVAAGRPVDGAGNPVGLEQIYLDFVQPEKLIAYEVGYKGVFAKNLMVDVNYYHNDYKDFLAQQNVRNINPTVHKGVTIPALTAWRPNVNAKEELSSWGLGLGVSYNLPMDYFFSGNYSYATFSLAESETSDFQPGFNTPKNRFNISVGNREIIENLGFSISYRYQQEFKWQNSFGEALIPEFGVLDAQVNYKIKPIKTVVKLGGTNLAGGDYRTNIAAPFVGKMFFLSITYDEFLN